MISWKGNLSSNAYSEFTQCFFTPTRSLTLSLISTDDTETKINFSLVHASLSLALCLKKNEKKNSIRYHVYMKSNNFEVEFS